MDYEYREGLITPYIVTCKGTIYSRPRFVRRRNNQTPEKLCEFTFRFRGDIDTEGGGELPDLENDIVVRNYETRVQSFIETDEIYTDDDGVIHRFKKPNHDLWWLELTEIGIKVLKPYKAMGYRPIAEGPVVEGEVVSSEIVEPVQEAIQE